jgi:hypothetical protein
MRLLVFLHGTTIMHPGAVGLAREERVEQARTGSDPALHDYASYVPVDGAVEKLRRWSDQGAQIAYLSSHRDPFHVAEDERVLERHGFPTGPVLARLHEESYGEVAELAMPDVLIEDDCESIGADQITYPQIRPEARVRITSIVVPEFGGIDHLPDSLHALVADRR